MNSALHAAARRGLALLSWPWARHGRLGTGIRILMYHRVARRAGFDQLSVTPERFERHMAWLARHHEVLPLAQAVQRLAAGVGDHGNAVVITFDDGYRDTLENALPVLSRHGLPATVFVTTRFGDQSARHPRYDGEPGPLHMDWSEVRALARVSGITIGSHTLSHPYLPRLGDAEAAAEIHLSRRILQERLGLPIDFFCYPNGDHGEREARLAREAGYKAAVAVSPGANRGDGDLFRLHRTEVCDHDETLDLRLKLAGAFDPIHTLLHRRRRRRFAAAVHTGFTTSLPEGQ